MGNKATVFDFQAEVGLTKQIGGLKATDELIELCHINEDKYVLDVGCGVGVTSCYLAIKYGCKVVGVDISEKMIDRSNERARRERVEDLVEFRVADVRSLPFTDDLFDIVIGESVIAFPKDKQRAVNECVRVTKLMGYVGFNESTWIKSPPPKELNEWVSSDLGGNAEILSSDAWVKLLKEAGLKDIVAKTYRIKTRSEAKNIIDRYGLMEMLGIWYRILRLYVTSSAYRSFLKTIREVGPTPENLNEYFGYGIYVGKK